MITKLFKSPIRPILEYGNLIWGLHYLADQQAIEGVQRCATKLISSIATILILWGLHYLADQQAIEGVQRCATKLISSIATILILRDLKF